MLDLANGRRCVLAAESLKIIGDGRAREAETHDDADDNDAHCDYAGNHCGGENNNDADDDADGNDAHYDYAGKRDDN